MKVVGRKKRLSKGQKIALLSIILLIVGNFTNIASSVNKLFVHGTKKVLTVTKTMYLAYRYDN